MTIHCGWKPLRRKRLIPGGDFDPDSKQQRLEELEKLTQDPSFWNDKETAEKTYAEIASIRDELEPWNDIIAQIAETREFLMLLEEEFDEQTAQDVGATLETIETRFEQLKIASQLHEIYDRNNAFMTIHSGAGGTEACDWVHMLLRMYTRWSERSEFTLKILDMLEAEGGIKSVTVQLDGKHAYGYLKGESGIHRLVRISPFDQQKRRHTSFASVFVSPVIEEDIDVTIKPEDIRVDTYRASGAGGQHVNKTDSAVRLTHLESGIVVQCQNERSQHKNRAMAMKVLTSRLYEYYRQQNEEEQSKHSMEKKEISWGHQIRSYVFQPYTMVKDHRTGLQIGNIQSVMDGNIDPFIEAYLTWRIE